MIRRFQPDDAQGTWDVFFAAVRIGAAGHYAAQELIDWVPSDQMPVDWGDWLDRNITYVGVSDTAVGFSDNSVKSVGLPDNTVTGFFMLERDGYLNMAFVRPDLRRSGLAQQIYAIILADAQALRLPRLTVWASRLAMPFFRWAGWVDDPDPPPRDPHPIPSNSPQPIEWALKLDLNHD